MTRSAILIRLQGILFKKFRLRKLYIKNDSEYHSRMLRLKWAVQICLFSPTYVEKGPILPIGAMYGFRSAKNRASWDYGIQPPAPETKLLKNEAYKHLITFKIRIELFPLNFNFELWWPSGVIRCHWMLRTRVRTWVKPELRLMSM